MRISPHVGVEIRAWMLKAQTSRWAHPNREPYSRRRRYKCAGMGDTRITYCHRPHYIDTNRPPIWTSAALAKRADSGTAHRRRPLFWSRKCGSNAMYSSRRTVRARRLRSAQTGGRLGCCISVGLWAIRRPPRPLAAYHSAGEEFPISAEGMSRGGIRQRWRAPLDCARRKL